MKKHCRAFVLFSIAIMVLGVISVAGIAKGQQVCGPMDVAFVVDTTGSMDDDIAAVQAGLGGPGGIIAQLQAASGGDLRLGLIIFDTFSVSGAAGGDEGDGVKVMSVLTTDVAAVQALIAAPNMGGPSLGYGTAEASDEAVNTAVNNLLAGPPRRQIGDFNVAWRGGAIKIVILVTDAPPGGFNDVFDAVDATNAHSYAVAAATKTILISAIYVNGDAAVQALMQDYATTTGGVYVEAETAEDVASGVGQIISECGGAAKPAVGGHAVPVNKLELLAPWIALASVVSLAGAVAVALKKGKR